MVAGLEEISKGTIHIGDRLVNDVPPKDRDIAMVFQNYALYPHMSVYDNMAFGLKLRKFKKDEISRRVNEAATILGLDEYLERRPKALSGGQRQRVAMGRAIVREPAVFLFDEPLSNLDAKMRVEMRKEILQLHRRIETTMLYVTHDQIEAMTLGDRICVMNDGLIEQVGPPTVIFDHPASLFVARFIGTPPMNIFEGTLQNEGGKVVFDGGSIRCPLPADKAANLGNTIGKKVCLGIRPRALNLVHEGENPEVVFEGKVEISEMLGEEVLVHVESAEHKYITSINPHQASEIGKGAIRLTPDFQLAHIFDAESGTNLTLPEDVKRETLSPSAQG
jgi:multiple sugar transport system ATP-binding protein